MKKKYIALFSGMITGIAAYAASVYTFCSLAFDKNPKISLSVGESPMELDGIAKKGQDWLLANDKQIYTMINDKGMHLKAHYFPCENAKRTVIEFHGWRSCWHRDFSASSPFLHAMGCNLLLVEQRGQKSSDGTHMTFGLDERLDVPQWVDWYQKHVDAKIPIYIAGVSMGASTVLMAASESFPIQVRGILADCGFTSAYEIIRVLGKYQFHIPEHPIMEGIRFLCKKKYGVDIKSWTTIDAVKQTNLPILFIHGDADTFVPSYMTMENYEACVSEKDLLIVKGATHAMSFIVDQEAYIKKIEKLFTHDTY